MLGKKSDILVIYPELNMSRYECDKSYSFYLKTLVTTYFLEKRGKE